MRRASRLLDKDMQASLSGKMPDDTLYPQDE
jgi:hypothetical protein